MTYVQLRMSFVVFKHSFLKLLLIHKKTHLLLLCCIIYIFSYEIIITRYYSPHPLFFFTFIFMKWLAHLDTFVIKGLSWLLSLLQSYIHKFECEFIIPLVLNLFLYVGGIYGKSSFSLTSLNLNAKRYSGLISVNLL